MIQNFANDNAEQAFVGADFFSADTDVAGIRKLTAQMRFLDDVSSEEHVMSLFQERVREITETQEGKWVVVDAPLETSPPSTIEFRLLDGDVYDVAVRQA
jgi:hypothetical protein